MNKIKRERFEIIRGTIVVSITLLLFYTIIGVVIMALLGIISSKITDFFSNNDFASIAFTFVVFMISTLCTVLLFFKNRDLEEEVGKDILKYVTIVLLSIAIIIAIVSCIKANIAMHTTINTLQDNYINEYGISDDFNIIFNELHTMGNQSLGQNILYIGIKLFSRIITILVAIPWFGKFIVSQILPEEV